EWAQAAQFDPLSSTERFQLGLPKSADVRQWPQARSKCDAAAAAPYDPERRSEGVVLSQIVWDTALTACKGSRDQHWLEPRTLYQHGRALMAAGRSVEARRELEEASARGYRVAGVDLARLLLQSPSGMGDLQRSVSLLQQAWKEGVTIAGFELGSLYERGI